MASQADHGQLSPLGRPAASTGATLRRGAQHLLDRLFAVIDRLWAPFVRISLAVVLIWLGADKFANPTYTVGLVRASPLYGFLATNGFVYALAVLEIIAAGFLLINRAVRYVGLLVILLLAGTFSIFLTTPAVTFAPPPGFPVLSHTGEFLLKDLVLAAAALAAVAHDVRQHHGMGNLAPHSR
jgi:uncharacterized membrane protein YkgB